MSLYKDLKSKICYPRKADDERPTKEYWMNYNIALIAETLIEIQERLAEKITCKLCNQKQHFPDSCPDLHRNCKSKPYDEQQ